MTLVPQTARTSTKRKALMAGMRVRVVADCQVAVKDGPLSKVVDLRAGQLLTVNEVLRIGDEVWVDTTDIGDGIVQAAALKAATRPFCWEPTPRVRGIEQSVVYEWANNNRF